MINESLFGISCSNSIDELVSVSIVVLRGMPCFFFTSNASSQTTSITADVLSSRF